MSALPPPDTFNLARSFWRHPRIQPGTGGSKLLLILLIGHCVSARKNRVPMMLISLAEHMGFGVDEDDVFTLLEELHRAECIVIGEEDAPFVYLPDWVLEMGCLPGEEPEQ